jgi:putative tryptophan/tyrosine transport system substrate-binding protein
LRAVPTRLSRNMHRDDAWARRYADHGASAKSVARAIAHPTIRWRGDWMRRRDFIALLGGAVVAPFAARAQQPPMPVIGFLGGVSLDGFTERLAAFRRGLKETGHVEGENVAFEFRWAENQLDRLPALAADLVRRRVAVIVAAGGTVPAITAKAATTTIPIVFAVGEDPVRLGLVESLARPGGNLTGINFFIGELAAKRLDLLRELVPAMKHVAVLVNPANPARTEANVKEAQVAGRAIGLQIQIATAGTAGEINAAFARFAREQPDALFVSPDPFFTVRRVQLATLAARHAIPTSFATRDLVEAGGLMSYGTDINDATRQAGAYAGRILKGTKPAELPVLQSTKFELVINHQTARMLGLTVSQSLLARADQVID